MVKPVSWHGFLGFRQAESIAVYTTLSCSHMAGLPPAVRRPTVVFSTLHCMCAADWPDGSRWRQLAAAVPVPRTERAKPPDHDQATTIQLPVTGGHQHQAKAVAGETRPWAAGGRVPPRFTGHKTRASHGHGRGASHLSPLTAAFFSFAQGMRRLQTIATIS